MAARALLLTALAALAALSDAGQVSFTLHRRVKTASANNNSLVLEDTYGARMFSRGDTLYEAMVSVGTPPQAHRVILDTGSGVLWLPAKGCRNRGRMSEHCRTQKSVYDPARSSTARSTNRQFQIQYGIGAVTGTLYEDTFAFGSGSNILKLKKPVVFGAARATSDGDQGIMGLAYVQRKDEGSSIFDEAVKQGIMDEPVFTVFFKRCPNGQQNCDNAGQITFGKQDSQNCGNVLGWASVDPRGMHWAFTIEGVSVNGHTLKRPMKAITDTGSSHLFVPSALATSIARAIGARSMGSAYVVPCSKKFVIQLSINKHTYGIPSSEVALPIGGGNCQLLVAPSGMNEIILGDPWIRSFCQVHDWKNARVGFATPK